MSNSAPAYSAGCNIPIVLDTNKISAVASVIGPKGDKGNAANINSAVINGGLF